MDVSSGEPKLGEPKLGGLKLGGLKPGGLKPGVNPPEPGVIGGLGVNGELGVFGGGGVVPPALLQVHYSKTFNQIENL